MKTDKTTEKNVEKKAAKKTEKNVEKKAAKKNEKKEESVKKETKKNSIPIMSIPQTAKMGFEIPGITNQNKPQEMRAIIPPESKIESNCSEVAAQRTEARHQEELSHVAPGGGTASSGAEGCPSCRLRDNHTHPLTHTEPCPQPGLSPAQTNLKARKLGKGSGSRAWDHAPSSFSEKPCLARL